MRALASLVLGSFLLFAKPHAKVGAKARGLETRTNRRRLCDGGRRRESLKGIAMLPFTLQLARRGNAATEAAVPPPPRRRLPEGWQAVRDPVTGDVYYWQPTTDVTQWEFPEEKVKEDNRKVYTTAFGRKVVAVNSGTVWAKVILSTLGIFGLNIAVEYQDKYFPSLKEARERMEFYKEAAEKYGISDDEPIEEAGFRAMEMARRERIAAVAEEVDQNVLENLKAAAASGEEFLLGEGLNDQGKTKSEEETGALKEGKVSDDKDVAKTQTKE